MNVKIAAPERIHLNGQLNKAMSRKELAANRYGTGIPMIGWNFFCRSGSSRGVNEEFILDQG